MQCPLRSLASTLPLLLAACAFAQSAAPVWQDPANWATIEKPATTKDILYRNASGKDLHLDVYQNAGKLNAANGNAPVLVYFHGGGWTNGEKPNSFGGFRAWLSAGFTVVTVEYRLRAVATAPAAVEDARCAAAWVKKNAATYHFDTKRVVYYGTSAGGHLAMMDGMLPAGNDIDPAECRDQPKTAAILDFYGVYLLDPAKEGAYIGATRNWIGYVADPLALERKMSPASYIRKGLPPVFIAHGDADPTVPYVASVTLKRDLDRVGVANELITVPGGGHGKWTPEENQRVQLESLKFLAAQGVIQ